MDFLRWFFKPYGMLLFIAAFPYLKVYDFFFRTPQTVGAFAFADDYRQFKLARPWERFAENARYFLWWGGLFSVIIGVFAGVVYGPLLIVAAFDHAATVTVALVVGVLLGTRFLLPALTFFGERPKTPFLAKALAALIAVVPTVAVAGLFYIALAYDFWRKHFNTDGGLYNPQTGETWWKFK